MQNKMQGSKFERMVATRQAAFSAVRSLAGRSAASLAEVFPGGLASEPSLLNLLVCKLPTLFLLFFQPILLVMQAVFSFPPRAKRRPACHYAQLCDHISGHLCPQSAVTELPRPLPCVPHFWFPPGVAMWACEDVLWRTGAVDSSKVMWTLQVRVGTTGLARTLWRSLLLPTELPQTAIWNGGAIIDVTPVNTADSGLGVRLLLAAA